MKNKLKRRIFTNSIFLRLSKNEKLSWGVKDNETLIEGNANDLDFSAYIDWNLPTIFVVAGVFQYFKEREVVNLIKKLQEQFGDAQILFDAVDEFGIKYVQRYVKKTGNKNAMMYFYINDAQKLADKSNTKLLSVSGFYGGVGKQLRRKLKLYTRLAMIDFR